MLHDVLEKLGQVVAAVCKVPHKSKSGSQVPLYHRITEIYDLAKPGNSKRCHGLIIAYGAARVCNALLEKTERVPGSALCKDGDKPHSVVGYPDTLRSCHFGDARRELAGGEAPEVETLTAREDCGQDLVRFCCCKDEHHPGRWLL